MKKIHASLYLLLGLLGLLACRDEEKIRFPELQEGVNARVIINPNKQSLNLEDRANTAFAFDVYSINKNIQSLDYVLSYIQATTQDTFPDVVAVSLKQSDFVNGKASIELKLADFARILNLPGGAEAISGGDLFNFRPVVTLTDGRVFDETNTDRSRYVSAPSITGNPGTTGAGGSSFTVAFNTFAYCPSNLAGVYETTTDGYVVDPDENITGLKSEVTVTQTGPTTYQFSDITAGLYPIGYIPTAAQDPVVATVNDICGNLTVTAATDQFGDSFAGSTGTVNADGTLTISFENGYGDRGTTVYRKK